MQIFCGLRFQRVFARVETLASDFHLRCFPMLVFHFSHHGITWQFFDAGRRSLHIYECH